MSVNFIFAIGVLAMQIAIGVLFLNLFVKNKSLDSFLRKYFLQLGFSITLIAVLVSLTYSTVLGYAPCTLCWWARIFIFPQLIIFIVALIKKRSVALQSLILSIFGILITGYHTYIDFGGSEIVNCEAGGVSCLQRYVFEFGYITIPVMALTGFVLLALLAIYKIKR